VTGGALLALVVVGVACNAQSPGEGMPAPSASLTPLSPELEVGSWVAVRTTELCLEAFFEQPSKRAALLLTRKTGENCLPNGFIGLLVGGPDELEGKRWWEMAGQGWVPEDSLAFHHHGEAPYPARPELVDEGQIAYVGPDLDVWVMRADGSGKAKLHDVETEPEKGQVARLYWSPTGEALAVEQLWNQKIDIISAQGEPLLRLEAQSFSGWSPTGEAFAVFDTQANLSVYGLDGNLLFRTGAASEASFSPDGHLLAYLEAGQGGVGTRSRGMLADLATGQAWPVDPGEAPGQIIPGEGPPMWSPASNLLVYGSRLFDYDSGAIVELPGTGSKWSPDGRFLILGLDHIYDVSRRQVSGEFEVVVPPTDAPPSFIAKGMFAWSGDSHYLVYAEEGMFAEPPKPNSLQVYDTQHNSVLNLQGAPAFDFEVSPNGRHVLFESLSWISLVDIDGTGQTLLAEGSSPTWKPQD